MLSTKKISVWWLVVTTVFGGLLGSGALWEWNRMRIEGARLGMEQSKLSLEIRGKMIALLGEIVKYQGEDIAHKRFSEELRSRIEYFNAMEKTLAQLEGRRAVTYTFPTQQPATPTGLGIK